MKREAFAPGAYLTQVPGEKFKRCKVAVHLVVPGKKEEATALAVLPHILDRRCNAIPDALQLSRRLFDLYGAEMASESYIAGANRVVTLGISGLKNAFALNGEDLAGEYLALLCDLLFHPYLENGVFATEDVAIEREKQADFLRSEMNDKRGYCLRQARRKLYGNSVLGIESAGYLEDIPAVDGKTLYAAYRHLLRTAQIEVMVCGVDPEVAARHIGGALEQLDRAPLPLATAEPLPQATAMKADSEPMATAQGKLAILCTSGRRDDGRGEAVMRLAGALYGGLPTSRLFMNVREKQSLCYYCAAGYGYFGGVLTIDSGVDHKNADRAAKAILKELEVMQAEPVSAEELDNAKRYLRSVFSSAKDSPDAQLNFIFTEWLKGTNRTLDEMITLTDSVKAEEVQAALAEYRPAVRYTITAAKEDA